MSGPRFVFVGGVHRSGTTLVASLLAAHPDARGLSGTGVWGDEGQHLQTVIPPARALGGPGAFGWHPQAHLDERSLQPGMAEALLEAWEPWFGGRDGRLIEKSPPNLLRFRLLQALFPGSACVAVIRHPIAVALSTRHLRRAARFWSVPRLVEHWVRCHELYAADRPHLEHAVELRYEDLARSPQEALSALGDALALPGLQATTAVSDASGVARWRWERWRRWATQAELRRLEAAAPAVEAWGYDLLAGP